MIARKTYLDQLKAFIDKPLVKVLTGIRRSGKSSVLLLLKDKLIQLGIEPEQIIFINLESFNFSELRTASKLYHYILEKAPTGKKVYLLLDEIQEVSEWERAVNSLMVDLDTDIYLTGSNSHLLSSELATYLAGRYVEIPVYTLSFSEYLDFRQHYALALQSKQAPFLSYLRLGGFPVLHIADYNEESAYKVVYDIYSSVILRDSVQRYNIRDVELLERVVKYVFDNIGNTFSGKNVADYFKSQQRKTDINTIYNYLHALEGAFIVYRAPRYDIKGKEILKTQEKFYLSDIGLLYATMGYRDRMISGILENIVYLELRRRGYQVYVGKLNSREIDFIAEKQGNKLYVQVAYKLESRETVEREFSTLLAIKDQYPKYVVTMDEFWKESVEGVLHYYISDFLVYDGF
ncbi:MAG: ATPase [Cytophagaceae bacterium SCN 52-12]|mgnify:CR=1 FL=1|nr:MAG: ATPase [Cytophagaceae bacterium SCN 52-12]